MYRFRLTKLVLRDGSTVEPAQVTLIVGPNNSGKSRLLKEIDSFFNNVRTRGLLLKDAEFSTPTNLDELRESYDVEGRERSSGQWAWAGLNTNLNGYSQQGPGLGEWPKAYESIFPIAADQQRSAFISSFARGLVAYLTTEFRLQLVKENKSPDNENVRACLLHQLYYDGKRGGEELSRRIKEAFNLDIVLDYFSLVRMLLRIGVDFKELPSDTREALRIVSKEEKLDDQGDGLRAFVGIVVALLVLNRGIFLIDEPETFLHPPQSFRIGKFLGDQAAQGRQVIAATHSADVLRGVLSSGAQTTILRIDRTGNTNSFRVLDTEQIKAVATDPLLSSARVLDGLFYSGAVVVEADADARFYQMMSTKRRRDLDLHFVNADNKQTVPRIMGIYRDMGVRCVGIVDFDVLNNAAEFEKQLEAIRLQEPQKSRANSLREQIARVAKESPPTDRLMAVDQQLRLLLEQVSALGAQSFTNPDEQRRQQEKLLRTLESRFHELADTTKAWREFKQRGRAALPAKEQQVFDELARTCAMQGLFINPCGELESMLSDSGLEYTTDKRKWIVQALQYLQDLNVNDTKNPWAFMKQIHEYIGRP